MWPMTRFTICARCERYTQTSPDRICLKCWKKAVATLVAYLSRAVW